MPAEQRKIEYVDLMDRLSQFTEDEREWIFRSTMAIQPTFGCDSACSPFCQAPRGVSGVFTFDSLKKAIEEYGDLLFYGLRNFDVVLHWHSEPCDYRHEGKTIADVVKLLREGVNFVPCISTSLPEYGFDIALQLFDDGILVQKPHARGKISKPYYANEIFLERYGVYKEAVYPTEDRINKFIKYLAKAKGFGFKEAEGKLPIEETLHKTLYTMANMDFVLILPKDGALTGVYFHESRSSPLSYLGNEITPENIGNYTKREINPIAIKNRINAPRT